MAAEKLPDIASRLITSQFPGDDFSFLEPERLGTAHVEFHSLGSSATIAVGCRYDHLRSACLSPGSWLAHLSGPFFRIHHPVRPAPRRNDSSWPAAGCRHRPPYQCRVTSTASSRPSFVSPLPPSRDVRIPTGQLPGPVPAGSARSTWPASGPS